MIYNLLAIDPGSERSAFLWCRVEPPQEWALPFGVVPLELYEWKNSGAYEWQSLSGADVIAIETMRGIFIPAKPGGKSNPPRVVGRDQMEAQWWGGVFAGRWMEARGPRVEKVNRATATSVVCAEFGGKGDAAVKAALVDLYGGEAKAIGGRRCKKCKRKDGLRGRDKTPCENCWHRHGDHGYQSPRGIFHDWKGSHGYAALAVAIVAAQRIGKDGI